MNIKCEIKQIKNKLEQIEKELNKSTTIDDIKVGEQFIYNGHNYTKLTEYNYCIIDDYDDSFMNCIFDPISNNYDESLVRQYINSYRFIGRLGANKNDLEVCYDDKNCITLISMDEYKSYKNSICNYSCWWMSRSSYSSNDGYFCCFNSGGYVYNYNVNYSNGVRVCFILKHNTSVTRK